MFWKGKTCIIAKLHRTDRVICSHSREVKPPSYSRINTVPLAPFSHGDNYPLIAELDPLPQSPVSKVPLTSQDDRFFDAVESDVSRIIRQEKMQEEYKKVGGWTYQELYNPFSTILGYITHPTIFTFCPMAFLL